MLVKAILLILIGALIGWITNYIAIKMLFRPYKPINFGLFKIQGLIPKRRHQIGESIAETVQNELISVEDIVDKLENSNMDEEMEAVIDKILEERLEREITAKFPMLAMFLNGSTLKKIQNSIKNAIMDNKDEIIGFFFQALENNVDFKQIIVERVDNFSMEELEKIVFALAKKELKHIEIIGAILGGVIGVIQFLITIFI